MSFDALAPHYGWMEFVLAGGKLQRCRTAFLDRATCARNVLILGEGHGRFLVECRRRLPTARITCVDASQRMLAVARARLHQSGLTAESVTFIQSDVLSWNGPEAEMDLLVTHFFLDCFRADQLQHIVAKLARAARPGARWLLADFQLPAAGLSRLRARLILKTMYAFFRVATRLPASRLTPPDANLQRGGFVLRDRRESEWGLLRSDYWELPGGRA
jgi:ubiquinone/menaquinone biosynthesis C-methylase UbiE